ncbi:MAG: ribonuclease R, partial [Bacillota bacterium]|nr:ribonuclease R [Bacillota bacterium]
MEDRIIEFMEQVDFRPLKPEELAVKMNIKGEDLESFFTALRDLEGQGRLILTKKGRYGLCRHMNLIAGRIEGHHKGYAFCLPDEKSGKDLYISSDNLNGAMDRDRVIVRKIKNHKYVNGREEAEVVRILTRANERIVGTYEESGGAGFVRPDERRISQCVFVPAGDEAGVKDGDLVVVQIVKWSNGAKPP